VESARIVCDNVCFGFDGVFRVTDFGSCQYEVATCGEAEIWFRSTRFGQTCANPTKTKMGSLQNPVVLEKTKCFWTYLQFLRSLKPMVFYCIIFCYIIVQYTSIILYIYIYLFVYWCVCLSISPLCVFLTCLLNAKVKTLLQKLLARQGPVVLQLVQLWSVLSRLGQQNSSSAKGLPEIPYLETQWFQ